MSSAERQARVAARDCAGWIDVGVGWGLPASDARTDSHAATVSAAVQLQCDGVVSLTTAVVKFSGLTNLAYSLSFSTSTTWLREDRARPDPSRDGLCRLEAGFLRRA